MSDMELDAKQIEKKVSDLADAMEQVRDDQATRDDVVVEMKQAGYSRLELLAQALQPVFDEVPDDNEQFEFALTNGEPPRLWIDMTSFVRLGRDRRGFEFVKDTRLGRTMLGESDDRDEMKTLVTKYVAERMIERERMIEGDWISMRSRDFDGTEENATETRQAVKNRNGFWRYLSWFLIGLIGGAVAMILWAWFGEIPDFLLR